MRKHGWQLPYHPLQVVAVAVFLALGFAFYVFFAPFVGNKMFQYIAVALYTPLITVVFGLYIWCAAADPADPGVFKSKKYLKIPDSKKLVGLKNSKLGEELTPSMHDATASTVGGNSIDSEAFGTEGNMKDAYNSVKKANSSSCLSRFLVVCSPCAYICRCSGSNEESSDKQTSEDGMFYCSLCEVEVFKYSKHCRVCDKCVNHFDHHCRWLNNCIGKKNYRQFFSLMVAAMLLFILQWSTGLLVLVCCFVERKQFSKEISSKLGSSFSMAPFVIVVSACTMLAMIATLPVVQLFFFHILLIKKGLSTYDYIVAMRELEQEQEQLGVGGQQSPQMSTVSSFTGLSSVSSFNALHRGAWCTPPRMFLEDQFDVVPTETGSVSSLGKKSMREEPLKKKNPGGVKISPWTLARLNAEEVAKAAAEARKKSKILQPVIRHDQAAGLERDTSFDSTGRRMVPTIENNRKRDNKRIYLPPDISMESMAKVSSNNTEMGFNGRSGFAPPHFRRAIQTSQAMSSSAGIVPSSPESSFTSPDIHPFEALGTDEIRNSARLSSAGAATLNENPLSRSTSDGYDASGGEDSDQVPSRVVQRIADWSSVLFRDDKDERPFRPPLSSNMTHSRN
ncbi:probable protein S-acyltransferase 22 [Vicia villosa]|uniref:probable protein S-acyltransferase 22 n=1 Tax=Vicia villosa TaxID=3911 RepID=UPI00273AFE43|nr:probable protein S-acyltransferase 22 [Vicia villosa]